MLTDLLLTEHRTLLVALVRREFKVFRNSVETRPPPCGSPEVEHYQLATSRSSPREESPFPAARLERQNSSKLYAPHLRFQLIDAHARRHARRNNQGSLPRQPDPGLHRGAAEPRA